MELWIVMALGSSAPVKPLGSTALAVASLAGLLWSVVTLAVTSGHWRIARSRRFAPERALGVSLDLDLAVLAESPVRNDVRRNFTVTIDALRS
jgi:hypothetical protein